MLKYVVPVLHVSGSAAAEQFYCHQLGFRLRQAMRPDLAGADPCYMVIEREGVWLHLSSFPGDGVSGGVVYLAVENVDAMHKELLARNVVIDSGPVDQSWGNREMYVKDPDGNCIRFIQERAR
ncbi:MAG TPA: VOC family protein [bacterium]|nr:VOC family protein [bacterium]